MNKVLIKNAINQENIYMLDNHYSADFNEMVYSIKGRLKIISFDKFKLKGEKINEEIKEEFFKNIIGKLVIEYTNLNSYENLDTIVDSFYLSDLDDFRFKTIRDVKVIGAIAESFDENWFTYQIDDNFIPKIKKKITLFYLLPDEDTDYYFELPDGTIEEID